MSSPASKRPLFTYGLIASTLLTVAVLSAVLFRELVGGQMMSDDPFLNPVGIQLIHPPASSVSQLEAVTQGLPTPKRTGPQLIAIGEAQDRLGWMLRTEYQPPPDTCFVPIPAEQSRFDTVRARYQVRDFGFEIGQTRSMVSVVVVGVSPREPCLERARFLVNQILNPTAPISLRPSGSDGEYGTATNTEARGAYWEDHIHWFCEGERVGIITLGGTEFVSAAVMGPDEDLNRLWFLPPRRKGP